MASPDRDYITAHPYAVIVRYASGNNVLYASYRERALAEKLAATLVAQGKRAFVRVDRRLPELLEERAGELASLPARD